MNYNAGMKKGRGRICLRFLLPCLCTLMAQPCTRAIAGPQDIYHRAVQLAAAGHDGEAAAMLQGAAAVLNRKPWRVRMQTAAALLAMRRARALKPVLSNDSMQAELVKQRLKAYPAPVKTGAWIPALLAALFPGGGHASLGRWHDAMVAALLIWPMAILTLWAWRRRMGPVTVFFTLLTMWLWSGDIFSVVSLSERGSYEAYMLWWQGLWQAAALPGRPW